MAKTSKSKSKHPRKSKGNAKTVASSPAGFAPFFACPPDERERPLWRWFPLFLLAAFLLRVGAGLAAEWIVRLDETFSYLEQAHRLVFGYGQVPWEFSIGARTWLLPAFPAVPMYLCKVLGFADYITAVKIWNALLSLAVPAGMYIFGRRIMGETAARIALLFGCFWHEFILLSTHAFAEQYAAVVFFSALMLLSPKVSARRLFTIGFLLGLTIALRIPYLPLVAVFGIVLLKVFTPSRRRFLIIGGATALGLWGLFEYFTWGRLWHSPRLYADLFVFNNIFNEINVTNARSPAFSHLFYLAKNSYGLYVVALLALLRFRKNWLLLLMTASVLLFHLALFNQEYTNTFVMLPFLWMLIAYLAVQFRRKYRAAVGIGALAVTLAMFASSVPSPKTHVMFDFFMTPRQYGFFRSQEPLEISRDLARRPTADVRSVVWNVSGQTIYLTGGYYYLHHRVPLLFPLILEEHKKLSENRPLNTLATHLIAPKNITIPGFRREREFETFAIFINNTPEAVSIPGDFTTALNMSVEKKLIRATKRLGIEFPQPANPPLFDGAK